MNISRKLLIVVFMFAALTASAHAQPPREQLNQMVEQLQKTPDDNALREKIIKLAKEVKPAPAIPPEAKRAFVMGGTYQKEAKLLEDFGLAVKAFQEATTAAPWWGDAYYNLSVALESAKRYDEAKAVLTLYLLTNPKDAEQAQERLYAIDAKKNLISVEKERVQQSLEGRWSGMSGGMEFELKKDGDRLVIVPGLYYGNEWRAENVTIEPRRLRFTFVRPVSCGHKCDSILDLSLTTDGRNLEGTMSKGPLGDDFFFPNGPVPSSFTRKTP